MLAPCDLIVKRFSAIGTKISSAPLELLDKNIVSVVKLNKFIAIRGRNNDFEQKFAANSVGDNQSCHGTRACGNGIEHLSFPLGSTPASKTKSFFFSFLNSSYPPKFLTKVLKTF